VISERESCSVVSDSLRPHGLSVYGIFQARVLEWVAISFSAGVQLQQPGLQPEEMNGVSNEAASQFSWTACLFQAYDSLLYFYKNIRPEVWHFQFPLSQIYYLHKSLLLFKQSSCFSDSLGISLIIYYLLPLMCPVVNLWLHCSSCYIPQFTTYLPKSCLPLTSWAHYLLKRLLAIASLKIPNFYKL
jgi:hypothetical protein